jgi:hypothetical protein
VVQVAKQTAPSVACEDQDAVPISANHGRVTERMSRAPNPSWTRIQHRGYQ